MARYNAAGRLLHILLLYNEQFGQEQEAGRRYVLDLALRQDDLASLVGTRREWVNRLFKEWEQLNLLSYRDGRILILDLPAVIRQRDFLVEGAGS